MKPYGKVNLVALALIAAVVGGLWYGICVAPAYLDNLDVSEAVAASIAKAKNFATDETIRGTILQASRRVGTHKADDGYGNITEQTGLGLTDDNIEIIRDSVQNMIQIRVEYEREMELKPLNRVVRLRFAVHKEGPIPPP